MPLVVVVKRDLADFEITGTGQTTDKIDGAPSDEEAAIRVTNLKTGVSCFSYSVKKASAIRGKQSVAEACAKHLVEFIQKGK